MCLYSGNYVLMLEPHINNIHIESLLKVHIDTQ